MITIKDSVHSHIEIDGVGASLLDTPPVQRLRHIRQLGTVQLVYPSANHTRFEHSLGVYHLVRQALDHLGIAGQHAREIEAAAMVHDVGHAPFSHNLEPILEEETGATHDTIDHLLAAPPIVDVLERFDLSPATIAELVRGGGSLGQLLAGELDVDRMDYLVRDAHHTGVPYGTIDPGRLLRQLTFVDGDLVLAEGNVQSAENLLIARALMNPTVYNHHVSRISKAMLRRAFWELVDGGDLDAQIDPLVSVWQRDDGSVHPLRQATDHDVLVAMASIPRTRPLLQRLINRDLFKRAIWAERRHVSDGLFDLTIAEIRGLEREIADRAGVSSEHVLLDIPSDTHMTEASSRVLVNGEIRRLDEQSPLVRALQDSHDAQWRLGVYSPEATTATVAEAAAGILGLDITGPYVQERGRGIHRRLGEFVDT